MAETERRRRRASGDEEEEEEANIYKGLKYGSAAEITKYL
jgi:hypothetical protein